MSRSNLSRVEAARTEASQSEVLERQAAETEAIAAQAAASASVVLPQAVPHARGGGKSVQELQSLIEEALTLLAREPDAASDIPVHADGAEGAFETPLLGAAAGSEIRHKSSLLSRIVKTALALAAALFVALVPLRNVLTATSSEAYVNAPLLTLAAPATGTLVSGALGVGARVEKGLRIGSIQPADGGAIVAVKSPSDGKVWEMLAAPGSQVERGQPIAHVVACAAASVTAAVSETVYDRLRPGMPARFNFYGSSVVYPGIVANLLGRSPPPGSLAISPASLNGAAYRVVVSVPGLGTIPDWAVGRRGELVFDTAPR